MKGLYIAGPIRGVQNYRARFKAAEEAAKNYGWVVLNPANLPRGLDNDKYMPICLAMLQAADAVLMLDGWRESDGAQIEHAMAVYQHKKIFKQQYFGGDIPPVLRERRDLL